jgi:hypothetical protein
MCSAIIWKKMVKRKKEVAANVLEGKITNLS